MDIRRLNRWALSALAARSPHTTDAELARDAEIAPSTLADLKSGRRDASHQVIDRLADALGVDRRALLADPYIVVPPLVAVYEAAVELSPHINGHDFGLRSAIVEVGE